MKKKGFLIILIMLIFIILVSCGRLEAEKSPVNDEENDSDIGSTMTLNFQAESGEPISGDDFKTIKKVLKGRLQAIGTEMADIELIDESTIQMDIRTKDIPLQKLDGIGKSVNITFQEVDETQKNELDEYLPTGKVIMDKNDFLSADVKKNEAGVTEVILKSTEEGSKKFEEATGRLIGKPIGIFLGDQFISAPIVHQIISTDIAIQSADENMAQAIANVINTDSLPFDLILMETSLSNSD